MSEHRPVPPAVLQCLRDFLAANAAVDVAALDLTAGDAGDRFDWSGWECHRETLLALLKPAQRLARLLPPGRHDVIIALLDRNIHSAIQIAAIPRQPFIATYSDAFGNDRDLIESAYQKALEIRSAVVRRYLAGRQANEPHVILAKIDPK